MSLLRRAFVACVRPLLTLICVTLPRWWTTRFIPQQPVMPASWRARQAYDEGQRGEHP